MPGVVRGCGPGEVLSRKAGLIVGCLHKMFDFFGGQTGALMWHKVRIVVGCHDFLQMAIIMRMNYGLSSRPQLVIARFCVERIRPGRGLEDTTSGSNRQQTAKYDPMSLLE